MSRFRPDGPEPPLRCRRFAYGYALDGSEYPSYLVWPQRDGNPMLFWIPPQLTRFLSIMISFAHWVFLRTGVSNQCPQGSSALVWLESSLTCISPEMGCCVLGLVPIKNIVSTMWHGQRTGLKSRRMLSSWQPMKWIRRLNRLCGP